MRKNNSNAIVNAAASVSFFETLEDRRLRSVSLPVDIGSLVSQLVGTASTEPSVAVSGAQGVVTTTQQGVGLLDGTEVYAQRVDSLGNKVGSAIHVNTTTLGNQAKSSVSMAPDGSFVVGWVSGTQAMMREFNANGTPASPETAVSNILTPVSTVSVAKGTDGKALVTYAASSLLSGNDVYSGLFNSDGTVASTVARLNTVATGDQSAPTAAALPGGQYVTAFESNTNDGNGYNIVMQRLSAAGAAVGTNQIVNDITGGDQLNPSVIYNNAESEIGLAYQTTSNDGGDIAMQLFNTDGTVKQPSEIVNDVTSGTQSMPSLGVTDAGTMAVSYIKDATAATPLGTLTMMDGNGLNMGSTDLVGTLANTTSQIPVAGGATSSLLSAAATSATGTSGGSPTVSLNPLTVGNLKILGTSGNDTVIILPGLLGLEITDNGVTTNPQINDISQITVDTGLGNDTITVADLLNLGHLNCLLNGGAGNDTIMAGNTDDTLLGGLGNDILRGGGGADSVVSGDGNDSMMGEAGNDTLVAGEGSDTIGGGDGIDLVSFANQAAAVTIDLTGAADSGEDGQFTILAADIENAVGSAFGDNIIGNDSNNLLTGGAGDDTIDGGLGADQIFGGLGTDTVSYVHRTANLTITLDGVADSGVAGEHDDIDTTVENVVAGSGSDTIIGNSIGNAVWGNDGNDTIVGLAGNDTLIGGAGDDNENGGYGFDMIYGGDGNDTIDGDHASDRIDGEAGNDSIMGGPGNDTITGADGTDRIKGGSGNDSIDGNAGDDRLYGDTGADRIFGDEGNDIIYGASGTDYLEGDTGQNKLYGENGSDTLNGGDGQGDRLDGGLSRDYAYFDPSDKYISIEKIIG